MIYDELKLLLIITIILTVIQIWLSKKECWWKGLFVPALYLAFAIPYVCTKLLPTNSIRLRPDYYHTATYIFPGIWFFMIYFIKIIFYINLTNCCVSLFYIFFN